MIFCRNVLIYFDQDTKAVIFERIAKCLESDGTLLLGAARSVVGITDAFRPVTERRGLYQINPARGVRPAGARDALGPARRRGEIISPRSTKIACGRKREPVAGDRIHILADRQSARLVVHQPAADHGIEARKIRQR